MLVTIKYTMDAPCDEIIDLTDYGHDFDKSWDDLTEDEKNIITDSIAEQYCVFAGGTELSFKDNESDYANCYDEEQMKVLEEKFNK